METTPNSGNLGTMGSTGTGKINPAQAADRAHGTVDRVSWALSAQPWADG